MANIWRRIPSGRLTGDNFVTSERGTVGRFVADDFFEAPPPASGVNATLTIAVDALLLSSQASKGLSATLSLQAAPLTFGFTGARGVFATTSISVDQIVASFQAIRGIPASLSMQVEALGFDLSASRGIAASLTVSVDGVLLESAAEVGAAAGPVEAALSMAVDDLNLTLQGVVAGAQEKKGLPRFMGYDDDAETPEQRRDREAAGVSAMDANDILLVVCIITQIVEDEQLAA